jgi:hypothetical protein
MYLILKLLMRNPQAVLPAHKTLMVQALTAKVVHADLTAV